MTALIVAFDGLVVDSLPLRAKALIGACHAHDARIDEERAHAVVAGRSFVESAFELLGTDDATLVELVALRAQRAFRERSAQGVAMPDGAHAWLVSRARTGVRIVLRADSDRAEVESVLRLTELDSLFSLVRCADDAPRAIGKSSLVNAYNVISSRLDALGVSGKREAYECGEHAHAEAQKHVSHAHCIGSAASRVTLFSGRA